MNKYSGLMLIVNASLLFLSGSRPSQLLAQNTKQSSDKFSPEAQTFAHLAGYKHWTRVTKKPFMEFSSFAMLCAGPTAEEVAHEKATNPHYNKYIAVYVNNIGRQALLHEKKPAYPVGTIIVKEKNAKRDSLTPEMCTVMLKREPGYNPAGGNWQYFVTDDTGTRFQNIGEAVNCKSCHAEQKQVDYVFRPYVPDVNPSYYMPRRILHLKPSK